MDIPFLGMGEPFQGAEDSLQGGDGPFPHGRERPARGSGQRKGFPSKELSMQPRRRDRACVIAAVVLSYVTCCVPGRGRALARTGSGATGFRGVQVFAFFCALLCRLWRMCLWWLLELLAESVPSDGATVVRSPG